MVNKQTFLEYLKSGWSVIPIYFQSDAGKVAKKSMVKWSQYQERLATEAEVDSWMLKNPPGIALVTGELSRIVAVDVDDVTDPISLSSPIVVKSAFSGGRHYFYKWTEELRNTARIEGMPIDFRGDGGYIVLPPSSFEGKAYEYVKRAERMYLNEVPPEIRKMLESREDKAVSFTLDSDADFPYREASAGNRNDAATRITGSLLSKIDSRLWEVAVWGTLRQWNSIQCHPPLPEHELRATYESVRDAERRSKGSTKPTSELPKPSTLAEVSANRLKERGLEIGAPSTGYKELDEFIKGFLPGHVYLTSGDTNVGKTSICCNFAHRVSQQGKKVLYFALEPENTIADYLASIRTKKRFSQLVDGDLVLEDTNIDVFGKESIRKIEDLVAVVGALPRYDLIIVDHIGYFTSDGNTHERQANVMKQLAGLSKAKQSAIMVVAHIRKRNDRAKQLHEDDISGSGAFKQDATEVLLVVRESEQDSTGSEIYTDRGAILIRKTKAGKQGQVQIQFNPGGAAIYDSYDLADELFS